VSYSLQKQISWQQIGSKVFVFDEPTGSAYIFEDTAYEIWMRISKGLSLEHITHEMSLQYDVNEERIKDDALEFISSLSLLNLISSKEAA